MLRDLYARPGDREEIGAREARVIAGGMERFIRFRDLHPELEGRFIDVKYSELVADPLVRFPPIFLARGTADEWYTTPKFENDVAALRARGAKYDTLVYEAPHEWTPAVSEAAGAWLERLVS